MEQQEHDQSVAGAKTPHAPDGIQQQSVDVKSESHSSSRCSHTTMKTLTQTWEPKLESLTTESAPPKPNNLLTKADVKPKILLTTAVVHHKKNRSNLAKAARKNDKVEVHQLPKAKP
ncbi:hypothetical protein GQ600_6731 [Phytophthora cactorum]|nr:hypothetical protein GQ600_6731 [Phytophthora cactorum]